MCWLTINVNALLFFYACFFRMNNYLSLYFEVLHQHQVLDTGDWFRWARTHKSNIFKTVAYYTIQLQRNLLGMTCVTPWEDISIKKCTKSIVVLDHTVILSISCQYSITLQKTIDTSWKCWCIWRLNKGKYITLNILEGHCRSYFYFKVYLSCCPIYSSFFPMFCYVRGIAQNNLTLSIW